MGSFAMLPSLSSVLVVMVLTYPASTEKLSEVATSEGLDSLVNLMRMARLLDHLDSVEHTLFGPTDEAFNEYPASKYNVINAEKTLLKELMTYHMMHGDLNSMQLADELQLTMMSQKHVRVNTYPKGEASFDVATLQCAPIDLSNVDLKASNGIVHVLNSVMTPPSGTIFEFLQGASFSTLFHGLSKVDLVSDMLGEGPYTLFAPTDFAFSKIPHDTLHELMADMDKLKAVLSLHVVQGTYCSAGLTSGDVETLGGAKVTVTVDSGKVKVKDSMVTSPDVSVTNGVVHVIDSVILP